jgi:hypothetical protein
MKQLLLIVFATTLAAGVASSQTNTARPTPQPTPAAEVQQRSGVAFEVSEYGVDFQADPRLIRRGPQGDDDAGDLVTWRQDAQQVEGT